MEHFSSLQQLPVLLPNQLHRLLRVSGSLGAISRNAILRALKNRSAGNRSVSWEKL